jgi:hypothetical protein
MTNTTAWKRTALTALAGGCWALCAASVWAAAPASGGGPIYTCTDSHNRVITSDRPILDCLDRDQKVLNGDGSVRRILPKSMTAEERAAAEEAQRRKIAEEQAHQDAIRRDRNLLARFPDEQSHADARSEALDSVYSSIEAMQHRLADLKKDRKPLLQEAEFYRGKALPPKLKAEIDNNQVSIDAQETLIKNQQVELVRLNKMYDTELAHLRKLWAGAPPGFEFSVKNATAASAPATSLPATGAARAGAR